MIRAVEGPLANIQDQAPEQTKYPGNAERLSDVWIAVRASLRRVLEEVTIADLRDGNIPDGGPRADRGRGRPPHSLGLRRQLGRSKVVGRVDAEGVEHLVRGAVEVRRARGGEAAARRRDRPGTSSGRGRGRDRRPRRHRDRDRRSGRRPAPGIESQKGWARTAAPPASWISSTASAAVGQRRETNAFAPGTRYSSKKAPISPAWSRRPWRYGGDPQMRHRRLGDRVLEADRDAEGVEPLDDLAGARHPLPWARSQEGAIVAGSTQ